MRPPISKFDGFQEVIIANTYQSPVKMMPADFTYRQTHEKLKAKPTSSTGEVVDNKDDKESASERSSF
jgi:hypothetical protein